MNKNGNIEASLLEIQDPDSPDDVEQITSFNVLGEEVDIGAIFERSVVFDHKGAVLESYQTQCLLLCLQSPIAYFNELEVLMLDQRPLRYAL